MRNIDRIRYQSAGVDLEKIQECPEDEKRLHLSVGTLIIVTSCFAFMSFGYMIYTVIENIYNALSALIVACCAGFLWSQAIFSIDRYLVSGMSKTIDKKKKEKLALPRLLLAFLISVLVSHPLIIGIMNKEILDEIDFKEYQESKDCQNSFQQELDKLVLENETRSTDLEKKVGLDALRSKIKKLHARHDKCIESRDYLQAEYQGEMDGTKGSGEIGYGPKALKKEKDYLNKKRECKEIGINLKNSLDRYPLLLGTLADDRKKVDNDIENRREEIVAKKEKRLLKIQNQSRSLLARHKVLWKMIFSDSAVFFLFMMFFFAFLLIETAPVLGKLFMSTGIYELKLNSHLEMSERERVLDSIENRSAIREAELEDERKQIAHEEEQSRLKLVKDYISVINVGTEKVLKKTKEELDRKIAATDMSSNVDTAYEKVKETLTTLERKVEGLKSIRSWNFQNTYSQVQQSASKPTSTGHLLAKIMLPSIMLAITITVYTIVSQNKGLWERGVTINLEYVLASSLFTVGKQFHLRQVEV